MAEEERHLQGECHECGYETGEGGAGVDLLGAGEEAARGSSCTDWWGAGGAASAGTTAGTTAGGAAGARGGAAAAGGCRVAALLGHGQGSECLDGFGTTRGTVRSQFGSINGFLRVDLRVNGTNHAFGTMLSLRTVEPDRLGVGDHDGKGWSHGVFSLDKLEAGGETGNVGHDLVDWRARCGEGSLGDGVVHRVELELDHLSNIGNGVLRSVNELHVLVGDRYDVRNDVGGTGLGGPARGHPRGHPRGGRTRRGVLGEGATCEQERSNSGCEMHTDCF